MASELYKYAKEGNLQGLKELAEKGADIHAKNEYALRYSASYGHLEVVKYLVSLGADIHACNEYALIYSASHGYLEVVKYIVQQGVNVRAISGVVALRYSVEKGHTEIVKYLVEQGVKIHTGHEDALRRSAYYGRLETVEYLLQQGADIQVAIKNSSDSEAIKILKKYLVKREIYQGQINETTELECGICLTEMGSLQEPIVQCKVCKKCVHLDCEEKWGKRCVYCRN